MKRKENDGRTQTVRVWTARLTFAALALATVFAWVAPVSAGIRASATSHSFHDVDGNVAYRGWFDVERTLATAKDGGKPEKVVWDNGGSYPYALLSREDRQLILENLAGFMERKAEKRDAEADKLELKEFYDAEGSLAFIGFIDDERTAATVKEGAQKPSTVFWTRINGDNEGEGGSYPYERLGEAERAYVDAFLAKFAQEKTTSEKLRRARAVAAKENWAKAPTLPLGFERVEGKKIAVLFGCGEFADESIPNLDFPAADAKLLGERLVERGFSNENIIVLADYETKRENFLRIIDILSEFSAPGDMIFVAFFGKGFEYGGEIYWVPTDAKIDDITATSVSLSEFTEELEAATPGRLKAIFFDACRENGSGNDVKNGKASHRALGVIPARRPKQTTTNVWTLCASASGGPAFESPEIKHGVFSYYFAEGLSEKGDANGDGVVTLLETFLFAKAHTTATVWEDFNVEQTPVVFGPLADVAMIDLKAEASAEVPAEEKETPKSRLRFPNSLTREK